MKEVFKLEKVKLEFKIDGLKKEKFVKENNMTQMIIDLQGKKFIERQKLIEESRLTRLNLEQDIEQQKLDLTRKCEEQDQITYKIKEDKKTKEGKGNIHNKNLANNYVNLIKDIVNHYNKKLKIKDSKILNINKELKDVGEKFEKYKAESEDLEKNATRDGINESINQIKFLQTEVFTCRNQIADEVKLISSLKTQSANATNKKKVA